MVPSSWLSTSQRLFSLTPDLALLQRRGLIHSVLSWDYRNNTVVWSIVEDRGGCHRSLWHERRWCVGLHWPDFNMLWHFQPRRWSVQVLLSMLTNGKGKGTTESKEGFEVSPERDDRGVVSFLLTHGKGKGTTESKEGFEVSSEKEERGVVPFRGHSHFKHQRNFVGPAECHVSLYCSCLFISVLETISYWSVLMHECNEVVRRQKQLLLSLNCVLQSLCAPMND